MKMLLCVDGAQQGQLFVVGFICNLMSSELLSDSHAMFSLSTLSMLQLLLSADVFHTGVPLITRHLLL